MTLNKIDRTVEKYGMLQRGDTVCVGVSGGADSMLLLSYLMTRQKAFDLTIICANVEHGIRGEESAMDSDFVHEFCLQNKIRFEGLEIDAPFEAAQCSMGVEEYSRKRRYEFFESLGADKIATAHNLSDSVETVLFHIARGTGAKGLLGIPPVRGNIIRPLIECSAEEIRHFCDDEGLPYVVDRSNADTAYTRNYIRHEIIPKFCEINPSFEAAVGRMISAVAEDTEVADAMTAVYEQQKNIDYAASYLKADLLREMPTAVAKRILSRWAEGNGVTLDEKHLNAVYELLFKDHSRYQIQGTLFACCDSQKLSFENMIVADRKKPR